MSKLNVILGKGDQECQGRGCVAIFFNGSKGKPHWEDGKDEQGL